MNSVEPKLISRNLIKTFKSNCKLLKYVSGSWANKLEQDIWSLQPGEKKKKNPNGPANAR